MSGGLASRLWDENEDLARQNYEHPFVQGLGQGSLPEASFRGYVAQDAYFLEAFARAYAFAMAYSPDRDSLYGFLDLLNGVVQELKLHAAYARRWNVDLTRVEPIPATLQYTGFLLDVAQSGDIGLTAAAMTPCMRLYAYLGQMLAMQYPDPNNPYFDWIRTYSSPDFEVLAQCLESILDRHGADLPDTHITYRRALELELRFFEAHR